MRASSAISSKMFFCAFVIGIVYAPMSIVLPSF
jgi:hypothetical protein